MSIRNHAYLQAYNVNQSLVGDVNVTQNLGDWHPGNWQVERHKQRQDWSEPVQSQK